MEIPDRPWKRPFAKLRFDAKAVPHIVPALVLIFTSVFAYGLCGPHIGWLNDDYTEVFGASSGVPDWRTASHDWRWRTLVALPAPEISTSGICELLVGTQLYPHPSVHGSSHLRSPVLHSAETPRMAHPGVPCGGIVIQYFSLVFFGCLLLASSFGNLGNNSSTCSSPQLSLVEREPFA